MAYHSKYSGVEVDALLDKIKDDNVGSIDSSLSTTSENPVKNKVITEELNKKANKTDIATINGQTLTGGGNIEVVTGAYDDTEIKGKLTELDSQIEAEATARTEADAALQTQINGKQEALTLTVKDNGNIVLANIQGRSKEFMPATPSGDPMHYAYVAAGAEYNDTGSDIIKDAPWAGMVDDDYTGNYGKTVVHKAGYWYLNGLGDLTNEDMQYIYSFDNILLRTKFAQIFRRNEKLKTNICLAGEFYSNAINLSDSSYMIFNSSVKVLLLVPINYINNSSQYISGKFQATFYGSGNLIAVLGNIYAHNTTNFVSSAPNFRYIKIIKLSTAIDFKEAPNLSVKSVLYMINNEAATSEITITLHNTVYTRCMANADILAALQVHTNVSLASA